MATTGDGSPPPAGFPSRESIFDNMLQLLRQEVPDVASDPAFLDPALKLILKALAAELRAVYDEIEATDDRVMGTLTRRLLTVPRGARPAQTVAQFHLSQPGMEIGPEVGLGCTVSRPGPDGAPVEHTLEFRPLQTRRLGEFAVAGVIRVDAQGRARLETPKASRDAPAPAAKEWQSKVPSRPFLLLCIEARTDDPTHDTPEVFLQGPEEVLRPVLWGTWSPVDGESGLGEGWTPARYFSAEVEETADVMTYRSDGTRPHGAHARRFVKLPLAMAEVDARPDLLGETDVQLPPPKGPRWWWHVETAGDPSQDLSELKFLADCVPVANRHQQVKGEIVPDVTRQGIILPVGFDELCGIAQVLDLGAGLSYVSREQVENATAPHNYILRPSPDGDRVTVYLRNPPRGHESSRIEVHYWTTTGPLANGIGAGSLDRLLAPTPGLDGGVNLLPTVGGREAGTFEGTVEEIGGLFRHHGRAVSAQDYCDLALSLGRPHVLRAEVVPAVRMTPTGAERGVEIRAQVSDAAFVSELEREAFHRDLERQIGRRAPLGSAVIVRLVGIAENP